MTRVILRAIDVETTGLTPDACVIELGWSDVYWEVEQKVASVTAPQSLLFAPTRPITPENRAIHHLSDAELTDQPECTPEALRASVLEGEPFALVAANASFEQQWLTPEVTGPVRWICTVKAAARLYPDADSHSNQAIRYRMGLDLPEGWAMPPHRAGPDSYVTANILANILRGTSVNDLVKWTTEPKLLTRCPLGKWKGVAWPEVELSYLNWLLRTADMDADVQHAARLEIERRKVASSLSPPPETRGEEKMVGAG